MVIYNNLFLHSRLHRNGERNILNERTENAKMRRRRRHQIRKVLLALDYVVEFLGCLVVYFSTLVLSVLGGQLLLQHILLSVAMFVYAVPIPLAYLLNETFCLVTLYNKPIFQGGRK